MSKLTSVLSLLFMSLSVLSQKVNPSGEIQLLIRANDIGSFHSANIACIESYQNGIARSVDPKERLLT